MTRPLNISDAHRCIFVHVPKAAGTSIKKALDMPGGGHPTWMHFEKNFPERWQNYRTFSVVRNPWERLVSAFSYAQMENSHWHDGHHAKPPDFDTLKGKSFSDCVQMLIHERDRLKHESWHPQFPWLVSHENGQLVSKVQQILNCSNLEKDFANLCALWNIECAPLGRLNQSSHTRYRDYYDDTTKALASQFYKVDIQLFKFDF